MPCILMAHIAITASMSGSLISPLGGPLKQFIRFFFSPTTFINQLQWSRNHAAILLTFLLVAVLESQVGVGKSLNLQLAWLLNDWTGLEQGQALFAVTFARVAFLFVGMLSLSETLWWIGEKLGRHTSKRVLYRRLAVVLTLMLGAYTLFSMTSAWAQAFGFATFGWGLVLTYSTLREQFMVGRVTAALLGVVAAATIVASWRVSDRVVETAASFAIADEIARVRK